MLSGAVTAHGQVDELHVVALKLVATDIDDQQLASAQALVALPSRDHGPVPLPIANEIGLQGLRS